MDTDSSLLIPEIFWGLIYFQSLIVVTVIPLFPYIASGMKKFVFEPICNDTIYYARIMKVKIIYKLKNNLITTNK